MGRPQGKSLNPRALRDLLRLQCMTQSQVAAKCGLSSSGLSQLVHGTSRASARTVQALALALECDPGTLFPECAHFGERA